MSLEHIEHRLRSMGDPNLADMAVQMRQLLKERHNVDDIALPGKFDLFPRKIETNRVLQEYKNAWEDNALTPELTNKAWGSFWQTATEKAGVEPLQVPLCDRTTEELAELRSNNREVVLLPDELMTPDGLSQLKVLFPQMSKTLLRTYVITNNSEQGGCVDVEVDLTAPYKDTTEAQLADIFASQGLTGQRVPTFIIASNWNKSLRGDYFEEGDTLSRARLTGSISSQKYSPEGGFFNGTVNLSSGHPKNEALDFLGGRSEGRKKA